MVFVRRVLAATLNTVPDDAWELCCQNMVFKLQAGLSRTAGHSLVCRVTLYNTQAPKLEGPNSKSRQGASVWRTAATHAQTIVHALFFSHICM